MAEPTTMASFLQGRLNRPYASSMSEFTTPRDLQRERISDQFGWDVEYPGQEFARRALTYLPLATRAGGGRPVTASPRPATPTPEGPWTPGHLEQWLQGRYQPAGRPQAWQADRRWGSPGNEPPPMTWHDVVAGRIRTPQNRAEMIEAAKGVGAIAGATGTAASGAQFGFDTYRGEPWQTASWRALIGPTAGDPPSWWPQPPPAERPSPPSEPQPPSRLRSGWLPSTAQPPER
jgi:hypothetical protein